MIYLISYIPWYTLIHWYHLGSSLSCFIFFPCRIVKVSILRFIYSDFHFFFLSNSVFYPENSVEYLNRISPFESEVWYSNPHFKVENVFTIIRIFFQVTTCRYSPGSIKVYNTWDIEFSTVQVDVDTVESVTE